MSQNSKQTQAKRRKAERKLRRHLAQLEQTGEMSPWLAQRCLGDERMCRRVLPGLTDLAHLDSIRKSMREVNDLMNKHYAAHIKTMLEQQSKLYEMFGKG